jgi:DNA-binding beta-propeller fold protein YncE
VPSATIRADHLALSASAGTVTAIETPTDRLSIRSSRLLQPSRHADGKTAYVLTEPGVVPIHVASGRPGKLIRLGGPPEAIVFSPNGRTAYVYADGRVTPIATATNTPEHSIKIGGTLDRPAMTPDGKTLLVGSAHFLHWPKYSTITPVATSTGKVGRPIRLRNNTVYDIAVTPDSKAARGAPCVDRAADDSDGLT